jgi:hypothetical protein
MIESKVSQKWAMVLGWICQFARKRALVRIQPQGNAGTIFLFAGDVNE